MGLPLTSIIDKGGGYWSFTWDDTGNGPYRIIVDGKQVATVDGTTLDLLSKYNTVPPSIEVEEEGVVALSERFPPSVSIQWLRVVGAVAYIVERNVGGVWRKAGTVHETGESVYRHEEPANDGETVQLRVSAQDAFGNSSSPLVFSIGLVAVPSTPEGSLEASYSTGNITIEEA
jgi:hypothetical protein